MVWSKFNYMYIILLIQMLQAETDKECGEAKEKCILIDGLPLNVNLRNRDEFIQLYTRTLFLTNRRPYLDQLVTGLNHYGVSTFILPIWLKYSFQ